MLLEQIIYQPNLDVLSEHYKLGKQSLTSQISNNLHSNLHYYIHHNISLSYLGSWEWRQQVEQRWLLWASRPSQVQDEWNETVVSSGLRVVQQLGDSLLGFVRQSELVLGWSRHC